LTVASLPTLGGISAVVALHRARTAANRSDRARGRLGGGSQIVVPAIGARFGTGGDRWDG
jgi:hypothetical protein